LAQAGQLQRPPLAGAQNVQQQLQIVGDIRFSIVVECVIAVVAYGATPATAMAIIVATSTPIGLPARIAPPPKVLQP
jgi:hypothetical protein